MLRVGSPVRPRIVALKAGGGQAGDSEARCACDGWHNMIVRRPLAAPCPPLPGNWGVKARAPGAIKSALGIGPIVTGHKPH